MSEDEKPIPHDLLRETGKTQTEIQKLDWELISCMSLQNGNRMIYEKLNEVIDAINSLTHRK